MSSTLTRIRNLFKTSSAKAAPSRPVALDSAQLDQVAGGIPRVGVMSPPVKASSTDKQV